MRSNWSLDSRRASGSCRPSQDPPVIDTIFEDRDLDGYAFDLFVAERDQPLLAVGKRPCDISGDCTRNIMSFSRFFHSRCDVDRAPVNSNRPLGVALLADHDLAAMHPDAETRDDGELPLIRGLLPPDRASAVPYGQAGENAMRFPRLAHSSAAAHKLHSTRLQDR